MKTLVWFAPAAVLLGGVFVVPLAQCLAASLRGGNAYAELLRDRALWDCARNTLAFGGVSVALEMAIGLFSALLLDASLRLRGWVRAAAILPWALPTAVMAMSWRWIFNDSYGIANDLLLRLGLLDRGIAWLGRPGTAFAALVIADVWKTAPFVTLVLLAGLQSIPRELHDAMSLDGAGAARRFFRLTLPLLRPSIALALTFRLIQALGIFDLVKVLTEGGPGGSTRTVAVYLYDQLLRYGNAGYGAALTVVFAAALFLLAFGAGALARGRQT